MCLPGNNFFATIFLTLIKWKCFLVCCLLAMQTLQQQPIFGKKRKERVTVYSDWQIRLLTFCWHNLCILVQEGTKTDCMWPNGTNNIFMQISKFIFYTPISSLVEQILMKSIFHVFNLRLFVCIYTKLQVFQFTTDNCTFLKYCNDCYYNKYMYFGNDRFNKYEYICIQIC